MLKLLELRFSGIGRFTEEQVIDFRNLDSLVQVDGIRKDTGGSSGSGKTTVFNALDYLFAVNDIPNTVLQSRYTKEGISVTGLFDLDGKSLKIARGKSKLIVELDGEATSGSKLAEEKIDQILAMPRDLFRKILHKRQKEGGFFLQFTPGKTAEFLTDALGLGEVRKKTELVDKKLTELTKQCDQAFNQSERVKAALSATQQAISALGMPPVKDMHQEVIVALKKSYDAAMVYLQPLKIRHNLEQHELDLTRPQVSVEPYDEVLTAQLTERMTGLKKRTSDIGLAELQRQAVAVKKIEVIVTAERDRQTRIVKQIADLNVQKITLENQIRNGSNALSLATSLAAEIKKIQVSICPTCESTWITEQARLKETDLLQKVKKLREDIVLGQQASSKLVETQAMLENLKPDMAPQTHPDILQLQAERQPILSPELEEIKLEEQGIQGELALEKSKRFAYFAEQNVKNRVLLEAFSVQQRDLMIRHTAELEQVNGQIDITRRALDAAVQKLRAYDDARVRYENQENILKNQEISAQQEVIQWATTYREAQAELILAEEVKKLLKSYLSCSFDDALELIGDTATRIIRAIPNMANATVQLEGIRETKDGKIKEEVNAVINMDGEEAVPIKSLSGGERSSVDLAVDLAVIDMIENKTSKGIDIFILDEPFTGLDTVSIEMALEVLKNSNLNKRLVIVDHNPIISQFMNSKILVNRDGQNSNIVVN